MPLQEIYTTMLMNTDCETKLLDLVPDLLTGLILNYLYNISDMFKAGR